MHKLFAGGADIKTNEWKRVPQEHAKGQASDAIVYDHAQAGAFRITAFGLGKAQTRANHFVMVGCTHSLHSMPYCIDV